MADIQEISLDIPEEVQDIAENTEEIMPEEPVILEAVKPVIKPKLRGVRRGLSIKGHLSLGPKRLRYKRLRWKKSHRYTSPPLRSVI